MQQIRFQNEARFTAARAAYHQHVFVSCVFGVRRTVAHHQAFRFGEDDIILKLGSHEWLNILRSAPPGRAVLHAMPVLFGIFAFQVDRQPHPSTTAQANKKIKRMQTGQRICECSWERTHQ